MRKYEVTLPNGRVVSRQYAYQLKLQEADPEKFKELRKAAYQRNRVSRLEKQRRWFAAFAEKHGMTYYEWRKAHAKK